MQVYSKMVSESLDRERNLPDDVISTPYKEPGRRYCERLKTEICSETWLLGRGATPGEKKPKYLTLT